MRGGRKLRTEKDTLGKVRLPDNVYYGAQTKRAVDNFPISGLRLPRRFIKAQGTVKLAAARVNGDLGLLSRKIRKALEKAALEVIRGDHDRCRNFSEYECKRGHSKQGH
jgi:fumarate hydratase class II